MFSDITRDDVFRLETRRLWLRWPQAADAATTMPEASAGDPYGAEARRRDAATLAAWRDANAQGAALHLVVTGRSEDRRVIGTIDLAPVLGQADSCGLRLRLWLDAAARGQDLATEAVQAMVDAAFLLTDTPLVSASARVVDPAFRRVLEKSGFASCGMGLDPAPDGRGLTASDRFRLDRKAWASLKSWRVTGLPGHRPERDEQAEARPAPCLG